MRTDKANLFLNRAGLFLGIWGTGALLLSAYPAIAAPTGVQLSPSFASPSRMAGDILWQNAQLQSPLKLGENPSMTTSQMQQSLRAGIAADPLLNEIDLFRQTLRGSGKIALRKWKIAGDGKNAVNLELGKHTLPALSLAGLGGSQSSVGIGGQKFGLYTTSPVHSLNKSLASYDRTVGVANSALTDASQMTWLQVQPVQSKTANLQISWADGKKDLLPTSTSDQFLQGSLWGVQGNYQLPFLAKWNASGQWVRSNVGNSHGATAWQAKVGGPLRHPLGTTTVEAVYTDVAPGFESFAGSSLEDGRITKTLALTQPIGKGDLTANLGLSWNAIDRIGYRHLDLPRHDNTFNSIFSLRWQLASNVAFTAKHSLTQNTDELYPGSELRMHGQYTQDAQAGIELKVTPSVSFNIGAGMTSNEVQQQYLNADTTLLTDEDANYLTLGVSNTRKSGSLGINMQRNFTQNSIANSINDDVTINLNAQQKLTDWLSIGGKLKLADSNTPQTMSTLLSGPADLTASAQVSLSSLGAVQLSFSQWDLQNTLDGQNADNRNAYQINYLLGAHGGKSGLGFSIGYSQSAAKDPLNPTWKAGLTYR